MRLRRTHRAVTGRRLTAHVIWDWNGTLLDDVNVMIDSVTRAFAVCRGITVTAEDHRAAFRRPIFDFFGKLAGARLTDDDYDSLINSYNAHYRRSHVVLPAGALRALSVCSMASASEIRAGLALAGIDHFFASVGGCGEGEPDTKVSHPGRDIDQLGLRRSDIPFVGDAYDDHVAAMANDIRFIGYRPEGENLEQGWPSDTGGCVSSNMTSVEQQIAHFVTSRTLSLEPTP